MFDFVPGNALESALESACRGGLPMRTFLRALLHARIAVAASDDPNAGPRVIRSDGVDMVVAFTDASRLATLGPPPPEGLEMEGRDLFLRVAPGSGVILNPGYPVGFAIPPQAVQDLRQDLEPPGP